MTKSIYTMVALMFAMTISRAQTTAMQIKGADCNGVNHDLFKELDSGKLVVLFYFMPSCGSCPPPAQKIQTMANRINAKYPNSVKAYAFPFQNSTTCSYTNTWVTSNGLLLYTPMDSGAAQVAHYGGFGMPTVVLVGGSDHRVIFSTLSFSTSDTTIMRDSILALVDPSASVKKLPDGITDFKIFPNPASNSITVAIHLTELASPQIEIIDITGKQVAFFAEEKQIGNVSKQISTDGLPNGSYVIKINVNGKSAFQKLQVRN